MIIQFFYDEFTDLALKNYQVMGYKAHLVYLKLEIKLRVLALYHLGDCNLGNIYLKLPITFLNLQPWIFFSN